MTVAIETIQSVIDSSLVDIHHPLLGIALDERQKFTPLPAILSMNILHDLIENSVNRFVEKAHSFVQD